MSKRVPHKPQGVMLWGFIIVSICLNKRILIKISKNELSSNRNQFLTQTVIIMTEYNYNLKHIKDYLLDSFIFLINLSISNPMSLR